jgi:hypothetical protein
MSHPRITRMMKDILGHSRSFQGHSGDFCLQCGDYKLVFNEGPTKTQAKAAAEEVRKDALANVSNQPHMQSYKQV